MDIMDKKIFLDLSFKENFYIVSTPWLESVWKVLNLWNIFEITESGRSFDKNIYDF